MALADALRGVAGGFKIGSRLFTSEGPSIVRALTERGDRVFLDLKFHDIPNTVATAVAAATSLGVWMVNVHASGGTRMMQAATDAAHETAARTGKTPPLVIAVTVLTSMNARALAEIRHRLARARSGRLGWRCWRRRPGSTASWPRRRKSPRSGGSCGAASRS